jgi:hypothetical protein
MAKNKHNETVGSAIERSDDRISQTGEVFTPVDMCVDMVRMIPEDVLRNPKSKFIDNSAGCGNFIVALRDELVKYHELNHVLDNMIYAVELMEDNFIELCANVGVSTTHKHFVNANALEYDYSFGEPIGLELFFN